jgi:replicative DNA helicase
VDDSPGLTILELRAKARRLKMQHDIKLLMIDYMQLMDNPRRGKPAAADQRDQPRDQGRRA